MEADLTAAQLAELEAALVALRAQIEIALGLTKVGAQAVDLDQPIGRISRVDALQQQAMAKASRQRQQVRLKQVAAALERVARGEYGDCLRCADPIGYRRLRAYPESPNCVRCQSNLDKRR